MNQQKLTKVGRSLANNKLIVIENLAATIDMIREGGGLVDAEEFRELFCASIDHLDLKVADLAEELVVSEGTISRWRNGKAMPTHWARSAILGKIREFAQREIEIVSLQVSDNGQSAAQA